MVQNNCQCCGRVLRAKKSIARGAGDVCAGHSGIDAVVSRGLKLIEAGKQSPGLRIAHTRLRRLELDKTLIADRKFILPVSLIRKILRAKKQFARQVELAERENGIKEIADEL